MDTTVERHKTTTPVAIESKRQLVVSLPCPGHGVRGGPDSPSHRGRGLRRVRLSEFSVEDPTTRTLCCSPVHLMNERKEQKPTTLLDLIQTKPTRNLPDRNDTK